MKIKENIAIYLCTLLFFMTIASGIGSAAELKVDFVSQFNENTYNDTAITNALVGEDFTSHYGGSVFCVAVSGNYAYLGQGQDLVIVDITNAANPSQVGRVTTTAVINDIAVSGNYAYLADGNSGLVVVDISNRASPAIRGTYTYSSGAAYDVAVSGSYAYVAYGTSGLIVVDITKPTALTFKGRLDTINAQSVALSGNYAYIADDTSGLVVMDITTPSSPKLAGSYDTVKATGVAVSGNYAYIADDTNGLVIVNIKTPTAPTYTGRFDTPGKALSVVVSGSYAYVADDASGLSIVNIANPASPVSAATYTATEGVAYDVFVAGNYAYTAYGRSGLAIVNITTPSAPTRAGVYDVAGYASGVAISGNYAYMAYGYMGLTIVDISNPASPKRAGSYITDGYARDLAVSGNYAYIADDTYGLVIVDVTNKASPTLKGSYNTAGRSWGVTISGNYAYVADGAGGLMIVDITNPAAPTLKGSYDTAGNAENVAIVGNYAYVADGDNGLVVLDITNPAAPTLKGSYDTVGHAYGIVASGNYAYVADGTNGLVIINISNPAKPTLVSSYVTKFAQNIVKSGNYVYIADDSSGLVILDVSNVATPTLAGSYNTAGHGYSVAVSGNYVYIADFDNGLVILHVENTSSTDNPPVANAGSDKTATVGSAVTFDGSASTDDVKIASYSWDFDVSNGITSEATGVTATHTYTSPGTYTVTLTVTDTANQKATDTMHVVVSSSSSTENTVSYTATYDNRLRQLSPTSVFSTTTYIDLGKSTSTCRDLVLFDLSGYKTTDTISKATLSLYWYYPAGNTRTSDTEVEIYRPVEWDPKYVTWNSRISGVSWSNAGGNWYDKNGASQGSAPYASLTFAGSKVPDNKYYDFDVTQLVQEYVSGKYKNTGFFLKAKTESGNYIAFYSSEYSNAAMRPKLTITSTSGGSTSTDKTPVANAGDDKTVTTGSSMSFDGSASTDDKGIASYSWDFDVSNGITSEATGVTATHTYTSPGTYTVTLTVTDTANQKATDTMHVIVSGSTTSVTYSPVYDNRLRELSPTSVLSTTTYLDIGKSTSICRDVMLFDLSSYKTTDTISKATLSLYWYYPAGATRTSSTIVEVYRPVTWDPKSVSWNSWTTAGGSWYDKNGASQGSTPYASVTFSGSTVPGNKYYDFDVTQLVKEYISGKYTNTGFFLKARTESGNYIAFYSSEYSNAAMRPKLTITQ
ncbi:disaggregatase related repeat-containing protein [uncultured Methanomethylovorans sp.]|uniref:disaggregatase related repeat-containing protein n=1 Tax=uncultured Methanomethylovorans sp. TaxID=183759 RepID=UPI002AA75E4D|nr:disaggregatase related repeat-containing protein [uncultured Methanomethylovorans sp.]